MGSTTTFLRAAFLLAWVLPTCLAQTPSPSSTSLSSSSSHSASSSSSSSSAPASTSTPSLSISGLPSLLSLPPLNNTSPALQLAIPATSPLYLTFSICSLTTNTSILPTIFISTQSTPTWTLGSRIIQDINSGGTRYGGGNSKNRDSGSWKISWDKGFGNWTAPIPSTSSGGGSAVSVLLGLGMGNDGTMTPVGASGNVVIQIGVSSSSPMTSITTATPYLGDTTSTTALLFTPLLLSSPHDQPSYPNYTLPPASLNLPQYPMIAPISGNANTPLSNSSNANYTLIIVPTGSSPTIDGLDNSICAVRAANTSTGGIANTRNMLVNKTDPIWMTVGNVEGFRSYWVVGDLVAGSNYTAWVMDISKGEMSSPIYFVTKEESFPCPLVLPSSLCPGLGYAGAVDRNTTSATSPIWSLPDNITETITSSLQAFSTSLLAQACGRDFYSHVSSCADCYSSYRDWICKIAVPRCTDPSDPTSSSEEDAYPPKATKDRNPNNPRTPGLLFPSFNYTELLPCITVCNNVDRTCPVNLQFRCPIRGVNANESYGYVGDEDDVGTGSDGTGWPAVDQWGWRWCNG